MKVQTLPLAGIGLSFLAACANQDTLEGSWEAIGVEYDGEDVTDEYLYSYTEDGCTYSSRMSLILDKENRGGFFWINERVCQGDESDSYGYSYGFYMKFQYDGWGGWSSGGSYYGMSCDVPDGKKMDCAIGGMNLQFRKES